jgi:hypothetical protein
MTDEEHTAYHEAAHAVAALWERATLKSATIVPSAEADGVTHHRNILFGRDVDCDASTANRLRMERLVRVCLAGPAATEKLGMSGPPRLLHPGEDEPRALDYISFFTSSIEETEAYYALLAIQAKQFLERPGVWAQVTAVAGALLAAKTLPGKKLRQIAREAFEQAIAEEHRRLTEK